MWPFSAKSAPQREKTDERSIESRIRALELDWEDTYERIRRVLQRISKRAEAIEKHEARESERAHNESDLPASDMGGVAPGGGAAPGLLARLSDRQKEIQRAIMRRRGGA